MKNFQRLSPASFLVLVTGLLVFHSGGANRWRFETTVSAQSTDPGSEAQLTVLHAFVGGGAVHPNAPLIQATDGNFYGVTTDGGFSDRGTVFTMAPDGAVTVLHAFTYDPTDGGRPSAALLQATDGNLYGTTELGGASGRGTVFRMTLDGTVTVLHSFAGGTDGAYPGAAALIQGTDGDFYGTLRNGGVGRGAIFKMTSEGILTILHAFTGTDGSNPSTALLQAMDGNFYGTAEEGGTFGHGTVFVMAGGGSGLTVLHAFAGTDGSRPRGLLQAVDGHIYGVSESGPGAFGSVFTITPQGGFTIFHAFSGGETDQAAPRALLQATDGNFYGTLLAGGAFRQGSVFRMTAAGAVTVLHSFSGGATDGAYPAVALIQARDGKFYGTTRDGGASSAGTAFRMTSAGAVAILHYFSAGADGTYSYTALLEATDGNFYSTTQTGGTFGLGTIFTMTPDGQVTVLHSFDGAIPRYSASSALIEATDGNFYGTTQSGSGRGTIFRITPAGVFTVLHAFYQGFGRGYYPLAPLIQGSDGNLYGTTSSGGAYDSGTVFRATTDGAVTILHDFGGTADGSHPEAALLQARDGIFYGTTATGGVSGLGTVFKMAPDGSFALLHAFAGGVTDGAYPPAGGLIQATDGNFYGTTGSGGASNRGIVYTITSAGTLTLLHSFAGAMTDGASSAAALLQAADGNFYGTTQAGGASGWGTVFTMTPAGTVTVLHSFGNTTDGGQPYSPLVQATDGSFYGTAARGGAFGRGLVFRLSTSLRSTVIHPPDGAINVDTSLPIQWTKVFNAQAYYLYIGAIRGAKNLVNTGEIQQTSYAADNLPDGRKVFARIWTKVSDAWRFSDSSFTTALRLPVVATLTWPVNGATNVDLMTPIRWTRVRNAQFYRLHLGTTVGAKNLVNSRRIDRTSYVARGIPHGKQVFARIWTKVGGVWRFSDSTFTTSAARLRSPVR